jgi:predicted transcriptional regulator
MNAQELIECFAGGGERIDRPSILRTLRDEALSKTELADRCNVSRNTVQFITELDECLVKQSAEGYYLTGAGAIAIREYSDARKNLAGDASKALDGNAVSILASTANKRDYLRNLRSHSLSRRCLASRSNMPTRRSIDRITCTFERAGYVTRTGTGEYALTDMGKEVIDTYEGITRTFGQILDKKHGLEWLGVEVETLPAAALTGARTEVTRPSQAFNTVHKVLDFLQSFETDSVNHVRVISCFANNKFDEVLERFVAAGVRVDVLSPADLMRSYLSMPEEDLVWSRRLLEPPNSSWLLHRGDLPCSLILIDDKEVVIAPRNPTGPNGAFGVIFSSDSAIITWAAELFDDYAASDSIRAGFWPRVVQMVKAGEYVGPLDEANAEPPSASTE